MAAKSTANTAQGKVGAAVAGEVVVVEEEVQGFQVSATYHQAELRHAAAVDVDDRLFVEIQRDLATCNLPHLKNDCKSRDLTNHCLRSSGLL